MRKRKAENLPVSSLQILVLTLFHTFRLRLFVSMSVAESTFRMSYNDFASVAGRDKIKADLVLAHGSIHGNVFNSFFLTPKFMNGRFGYSWDIHI